MELLSPLIFLFLIFWETFILPSTVAVPLYITIHSTRGLSSMSSSTLVISYLILSILTGMMWYHMSSLKSEFFPAGFRSGSQELEVWEGFDVQEIICCGHEGGHMAKTWQCSLRIETDSWSKASQTMKTSILLQQEKNPTNTLSSEDIALLEHQIRTQRAEPWFQLYETMSRGSS